MEAGFDLGAQAVMLGGGASVIQRESGPRTACGGFLPF